MYTHLKTLNTAKTKGKTFKIRFYHLFAGMLYISRLDVFNICECDIISIISMFEYKFNNKSSHL